MNTKLTLFCIIGVVAAGAVASLIPIHQVNAQAIPDLGRGLPSDGFPPNPNAEICGHAFQSAVPFC